MRIGLVIYGDISTLSGGYLYDRMLVQSLGGCGHSLEILSLDWRDYANHLLDNGNSAWQQQLQHARVDLMLQDELNHPSLLWANRRRPRPSYPCVSIVHHLRSSEPDHPAPLRRLYREIERLYLNSLDAYVANSKTTHGAVQALLSPANRAAIPSLVAYPAGDHLSAQAEITVPGLAQRAFAPGPIRVLFVGNVMRRKGLHTVLAALALLPPGLCSLSVVGRLPASDGYANELQVRARQLPAGSVTFLGRIPDDELIRLYLEHHVLAAPAFEGFGITYLEAMRFGLPVLAATSGAAREIVTEGMNGFLVAPDDAVTLAAHLERLAQQRAYLLSLSYGARRHYLHHPTWQQSMGRIAAWLPTVTARMP